MKEESLSGENYLTSPIELETERPQQTPILRTMWQQAKLFCLNCFRSSQYPKANFGFVKNNYVCTRSNLSHETLLVQPRYQEVWILDQGFFSIFYIKIISHSQCCLFSSSPYSFQLKLLPESSLSGLGFYFYNARDKDHICTGSEKLNWGKPS